MSSIEFELYVAMLEILKSKTAFNISSLARACGISRQAVYRILEKRTFQDLDKYRN